MAYTKLPLDYPDQIAILKQRGLTVNDEPNALRQLGIISYFRLATYFRPMEADKALHTFKPGSSFENAVDLYYFDKKLRALLFSAIQSVEVALRTKIIHHVSLRYGSFWFMEYQYFANQQMFASNLQRLTSELSRSREEFIQEHFAKYSKDQMPPAWKILELASFGTLSRILENLADSNIKKKIARELGLPQHVMLESWIRSISALRNCIAHHARVWNRLFPVKPAMPSKLPNPWLTDFTFDVGKLYPQICALRYLENVIHPHNQFSQHLKALLAEYPNVDVSAMGFPSGWLNEPLWK
ncbi:MAG: Abi family protein [Bacteroidales bacterium]|nr:Abi family protein [Bacteroidales bacterium]